MENLLRDLRDALRGLIRTRMVTAASLLSLTLGIAATTTVFSILDAAILRPAPFPEPDRLAILHITRSSPTEGQRLERWSWARLQLLKQTARSFEGIASFNNSVLTITGVDDPEPVEAEMVSANYFSVLGVEPAIGRAFALGDDDATDPKTVVILGHNLWRRRFNADPGVVGRTLRLNGLNFTVIGVAPARFGGLSGRAGAWLPAPITPRIGYTEYLTTNQNFISAVGRLRRDGSPERAESEMRLLGLRIDAAQPSTREADVDQLAATLVPINAARIDPTTTRRLVLLFGAVGLLLLLACANVANLLLGQATSRRREVAIRLSMGATRARLVRQLLTESLLLAAVAGVLGALVAAWAIELISVPMSMVSGRNFYGAVGEFSAPALDRRVLSFATGLCVATVLVFGLVPALRAARADLVTDLKVGMSTIAAFGRRMGLREVVVALEVALAVVLLVGGALMLTSYQRLRDQSLGFDPTHLLTFWIRPPEVQYPPAVAPALLDRVLEEIGRVPGVVSATVDGCTPLSGCARAGLQIIGRPPVADADVPIVGRHYVSPDFFRTLRIRVVRGRGLLPTDRAGRPHVTVINETAARRFWPDQDPIGQRVYFPGASGFDSADSSAEVVGIVSDAAFQPLDQTPVVPDFFTPYAQFTYAARAVLVRTQGDPMSLAAGVARAVSRANPNLALFDVQTMEARAGMSWATHTFQTWLLDVFAAIALLLAATGIYAVTAHFVVARTKELGIRIALGATSTDVVRASMSRTVRLGVFGLLIGIAGAIAASRVLTAFLYETSPLDVRVFVGVGGALMVVLACASYLPVRKALRVNPVEALRAE